MSACVCACVCACVRFTLSSFVLNNFLSSHQKNAAIKRSHIL